MSPGADYGSDFSAPETSFKSEEEEDEEDIVVLKRSPKPETPPRRQFSEEKKPTEEANSVTSEVMKDSQNNHVLDPVIREENEEEDEAPNPKKEVPSGYEYRTETDESGVTSSFYANVFTGVRWYSAEDDCGKTYYYEENGNESSWQLPNVSHSFQERSESIR